MIMDESGVWNEFSKAWPYHAERHEPGGGFDAGIPDVLCLDKNGTPGLLELKRPSKCFLSPSQWAWHERWWRRGGRSCVVTCNKPLRLPRWRVFVFDFNKQELSEIIRWQNQHGTSGVSSAHMLQQVATQLRLEL